MRWMQASSLTALLLLPGALCADILKTDGFTSCLDNADIKVNTMNIQYDKATNQVTFDVSGTSAKQQEVLASLIITAYGKDVYQKDFDPCSDDTKVDQLCPGTSCSNPACEGAKANTTPCSPSRNIFRQGLSIHPFELFGQDSRHRLLRTGSRRAGEVGAQGKRRWTKVSLY
jgi:ML-like domain